MTPKELIGTYITPVLVLITAVFGFLNNQKAEQLSRKTSELDNAIKEIELKNKDIFDSLLLVEKNHELREFDREFKFKIYEDVKQAVIDGNEKVQFVTADFVSVMVQDELFRDALLNSLINARNTKESVKQVIRQNLANEAEYQIQQKDLRQNLAKIEVLDSSTLITSPPPDKFRVDIFYLEETDNKHQSKLKAQKLALKIDTNSYQVRVRVLPKLTNAKSGYSIRQNQIRYEKSEEKIANEINRVLGKGFLLNQIASSMDNYISVFVRD